MKKVTKEQFYAAIGPRDICVTSRGFDHSRFETRTRTEVGRVYRLKDESGDEIFDDRGFVAKEYFLADWFYDQVEKEIGDVCIPTGT